MEKLTTSIIGQKKTRTACALLVGLLICIIALSGCGENIATDKSGDVTKETDKYSAVEQATEDTRTITLPSLYFEGATEEEVIANYKNNGIEDVTPNEDGSYTLTMSVEQYNAFVETLYESVKTEFDTMPDNKEYPSIISVNYNETFSLITLATSENEPTLDAITATTLAGLLANMYQQVAGMPVEAVVELANKDGEIIESATYPEAFENALDETSSKSESEKESK